jgi:hypothetical protein
MNMTLFGSFARGDDDAASDIDVVVVRPSATGDDDPSWSASIADWEAHIRRISGNAVNLIEVAEHWQYEADSDDSTTRRQAAPPVPPDEGQPSHGVASGTTPSE